MDQSYFNGRTWFPVATATSQSRASCSVKKKTQTIVLITKDNMYLWFFSLSAFILVTWIPGGKTALSKSKNLLSILIIPRIISMLCSSNILFLQQYFIVTPDNSHWVCVLAAKSPQNYILPHPDCTKFHVCQYLGGTRHSAKSWKAHIFNCPATTGFDELLKVCNHLYNLKQENGRCGNVPYTVNTYAAI